MHNKSRQHEIWWGTQPETENNKMIFFWIREEDGRKDVTHHTQ